jgi:hypothetical protein
LAKRFFPVLRQAAFLYAKNKTGKMKHYVYALIDPRNKAPYYIGKGKNGRHKTHFYESALANCRNTHKVNKIKSIRKQGYSPSNHIKILSKDLSESEALELETFFIEEIGLENLTNLMKTDKAKSGKQNPFYERTHSKKTRKHLSESKSGENHPFWNQALSEEHKENIRQELKNHERTEKHNKNIAEGLKGRTLSKEHKNKIGESLKGREFSEETKKKLSKSNREAHLGKTLSEDHKKSLSQAFEGKKNPESKLAKKEAAEIKWLSRNTKKTNSRVGKLYSISESTVSAIKNERNWKHIEPKKPISYE